jgi:hypothetical protein
MEEFMSTDVKIRIEEGLLDRAILKLILFLFEQRIDLIASLPRLLKLRNYKDDTARSYLCTLHTTAKWLCYLCPAAIDADKLRLLFDNLKDVTAGLRKKATEMRRIVDSTADEETEETLEASWTSFAPIFEADRKAIEEASASNTAAQIQRYIHLVIINLWIGGTLNARPKAIADMQLSQGRNLYVKGEVYLKQFKTAPTYKYQVAKASPTACAMMQFYDDHMRELCVAARKLRQPGLPAEQFPFFVTPKGGILGNSISKILRANIGMGTRQIRSKVETEAHRAHIAGIITTQEKLAIHFAQGHSERTSNTVYLKPHV